MPCAVHDSAVVQAFSNGRVAIVNKWDRRDLLSNPGSPYMHTCDLRAQHVSVCIYIERI